MLEVLLAEMKNKAVKVRAFTSWSAFQEPAPKGPRRPSGVGSGDLFFSDSE